MGKGKLPRFKENEQLQNVIQPTREDVLLGKFPYKGTWKKVVFGNNNPLVLELGCGKGEYSVGLAERFPDKNFVGVDIKGARFWYGAKKSLENNLQNTRFLRAQIELIDLLFSEQEVDEIWITFPDPQIKFRRAKLRLTHPEFLKKYQKILSKNGSVHLKTDSEFLHGYTNGILYALNHKVLLSQHDLYKANDGSIPNYVYEIQTHYEKLFLSEEKKITYLKFQFQ